MDDEDEDVGVMFGVAFGVGSRELIPNGIEVIVGENVVGAVVGAVVMAVVVRIVGFTNEYTGAG